MVKQNLLLRWIEGSRQSRGFTSRENYEYREKREAFPLTAEDFQAEFGAKQKPNEPPYHNLWLIPRAVPGASSDESLSGEFAETR